MLLNGNFPSHRLSLYKQLPTLKNKPLKINDTVIKWMGIPFTGILVFHLSGFTEAITATIPAFFIHYLVFTFISFSLWNGSAYAHYLLRNQLSKIKGLYFRIPVRYAITIMVSFIISYILLNYWNYFLQDGRYHYHSI